MTSRILPADEWPKLHGTELETVWPHLDKAHARVLVIESVGKIIACWALFPVWHVEGVSIDPQYRGNPAVSRKLLLEMASLCEANDISRVATSCVTPQVRRLLTHLHAEPLPGEHFMIPVGALLSVGGG